MTQKCSLFFTVRRNSMLFLKHLELNHLSVVFHNLPKQVYISEDFHILSQRTNIPNQKTSEVSFLHSNGINRKFKLFAMLYSISFYQNIAANRVSASKCFRIQENFPGSNYQRYLKPLASMSEGV